MLRMVINMLQGEVGFHLAHKLMKRVLSIPGGAVHWFDKPGSIFFKVHTLHYI